MTDKAHELKGDKVGGALISAALGPDAGSHRFGDQALVDYTSDGCPIVHGEVNEKPVSRMGLGAESSSKDFLAFRPALNEFLFYNLLKYSHRISLSPEQRKQIRQWKEIIGHDLVYKKVLNFYSEQNKYGTISAFWKNMSRDQNTELFSTIGLKQPAFKPRSKARHLVLKLELALNRPAVIDPQSLDAIYERFAGPKPVSQVLRGAQIDKLYVYHPHPQSRRRDGLEEYRNDI
ncbi:MAG: hypothetical protein HGA90_01320 [Alphaproteobacteria bacterium]|nr:hypothetical protein [Alphaproteobacteria bacterium]